MSVLLIAEVAGTELDTDSTAKALSAAKQLGEVTILVAGSGIEGAGKAAAELDGAAKVLVADDDAYAHGLAEPLADLIVANADGVTHIVAPSTAIAKSVLPRVAALLDVMVISDVTAIVDAETFERPIYAGNAMQTVKSSDKVKVMTIRTASYSAASKGGSASIEALSATGDKGLSTWVEDKIAASERPQLTSAKTVVSGGRALGSAENFKLVESLADKLGAAIGASRAAVDAGYAPNDLQVGQTGKVVAPDLYIAIGISGAIQHLAGMKDSKVIVAINKDEDCAMCQIADFYLPGDLFELVPELVDKI